MGVLLQPHVIMLACIIQHSLGRTGGGNKAQPEASVHHAVGHYPHDFIRLTNVVLNLQTGEFNYKNEREPKISIDSYTSRIWPVKAGDMKSVVCDKTFDIGYIFLVYHHYGSNYFHIHYDSILPIYQQLYYENDHRSKSVVLMPSVETRRLEIINWNTTAFNNPDVYWMSLLQIISGTHTLSPLTESLRQQGGNICLHAAYFGTPKVDFADSKLIQSYVSFIKTHLGVNFTEKTDKVGIIKRTNRRKILNEEELVASMSDIAVTMMVDFSGMSFRDQVLAVQEFSVLVGVNGAGLMNALYLPPTSVAVQLVPFNASVNFKEFGALLGSRGPYMEWHNTHRDLTRIQDSDVYMSQADTVVAVEEFQQLMKDALEAAQHARLANKQEL